MKATTVISSTSSSSHCRVLVKVWQVAWVGCVALSLFLVSSDDWARVLSALSSDGHLAFRLLLEQNLDRVGRVHAAQLSIVSQHF